MQVPCVRGLLAGRAHPTPRGLLHVERVGGRATVRVNTSSLPLHAPENEPVDLLAKVKRLPRAGMIGSWPAQVVAKTGDAVMGQARALHKTQEAMRIAHKAQRRQASKKGKQTQPQTLEFAKYSIPFTTIPTPALPAASVLAWYRKLWQDELVFKRFKSLAQLGHLSNRDDDSARAWLYGRLLVALLLEKLIRHASAISP